MDQLLVFVFLGIPASYLVEVFQLHVQEIGPMKSGTKLVKFPEGSRKVMLFDWIRRVFGAYAVNEDVWYVKKNAWSEVWQCPLCLSFWMSFIFSLPAFLITPEPFWTFIIYHFTVVSSAYMLHKNLYEN